MRTFGLIGYPLGHSFSRKYFGEKFARDSVHDCQYLNFEIPAIQELKQVLLNPELEGLNVTIPYKEAVIPFLHSKNPVVEQTGACNCIRIRNGLLAGFNTDVIGFEKSLESKLLSSDVQALILGTGGSSKAVAWVLKQKNIRFLFVSRKPDGPDEISYDDLNQQIMENSPLIVNTTPLGMQPRITGCPPIPYQFSHSGHYFFDLVYNPEKTLFLEKGEAAGARIKNGADMLAIQAEASWAIWNDHSDGQPGPDFFG